MATTTEQTLVNRLREKLEPERVITDPGALLSLSFDHYWKARHAAANGRPLALPVAAVVPRSEAHVVAVVRVANELGVPVVPRGGGSGTQGGAVPVAGGIVLDLTDLNQILEVNAEALTVTVQAGANGRWLEQRLNERGLMFGHYPAAAEWASVGGYVAARGSGVLSTRYGKIEDLVLSLRLVTPTGELIDTLRVPRHSVGPELTQLFVGSEGTLGVITRATLQIERLPESRMFAAVGFPELAAGVAAFRDALQAGCRPSVIRLYDEQATARSLGPVTGVAVEGVCALLAFEGSAARARLELSETLAAAAAHGARELDPGLAQTWWERRYDFYQPPHYPQLPAIFGTLEFVVTYDRVLAVYAALRRALEPYKRRGLTLTVHLSHWYHWGTMLYGRFLVPEGGADAAELHDAIWRDGIEAALSAGAVMNDHHGVGLKLAPFMREQYGPAFDTLAQIKRCLDPGNVMNPGKLGFR